jgi:hypothetical protein
MARSSPEGPALLAIHIRERDRARLELVLPRLTDGARASSLELRGPGDSLVGGLVSGQPIRHRGAELIRQFRCLEEQARELPP